MTNLIAQADMSTILAFLACLARLFRPSYAVHASPYGRVAGVLAELKRRRSRRVRPFVALAPTPVIPAPRRPVDALPTLPRTAMSAVAPIAGVRHPLPPANLVRPGYAAWERAQAHAYADRQRLGVAVAMDVSRVSAVAVTA